MNLQPRVVDYGDAIEIFADSLGQVTIMGPVTRFGLCCLQRVEEGDVFVRRVAHTIVLPTEAVGPGVELTLATFGGKLLRPAANYFKSRILM